MLVTGSVHWDAICVDDLDANCCSFKSSSEEDLGNTSFLNGPSFG